MLAVSTRFWSRRGRDEAGGGLGQAGVPGPGSRAGGGRWKDFDDGPTRDTSHVERDAHGPSRHTFTPLHDMKRRHARRGILTVAPHARAPCVCVTIASACTWLPRLLAGVGHPRLHRQTGQTCCLTTASCPLPLGTLPQQRQNLPPSEAPSRWQH